MVLYTILFENSFFKCQMLHTTDKFSGQVIVLRTLKNDEGNDGILEGNTVLENK